MHEVVFILRHKKVIYLWPLFTLGSVYSTKANGAEKQLKQIIHIEHNIVKNPNWPRVKPVGYLQEWSRIWTQDYVDYCVDYIWYS